MVNTLTTEMSIRYGDNRQFLKRQVCAWSYVDKQLWDPSSRVTDACAFKGMLSRSGPIVDVTWYSNDREAHDYPPEI